MDPTKNHLTNPPPINITRLALRSVALSVAAIIASTLIYGAASPSALHPPTGAQAIAPLITAFIPLLLAQILAHHTLLHALRERATTPKRTLTYALAAITLNTAWFTLLIVASYSTSK